MLPAGPHPAAGRGNVRDGAGCCRLPGPLRLERRWVASLYLFPVSLPALPSLLHANEASATPAAVELCSHQPVDTSSAGAAVSPSREVA